MSKPSDVEQATVQTLCQLLERGAGTDPRRVVLQHGRRTLTLAELDVFSNRIARGLLEQGAPAGAPMALLLENPLQFVCCLFGIWKAGGVAMPLPARVKPNALQGLLTRTQPAFLFTHAAYMPPVLECMFRTPIRKVYVLPSGGSTESWEAMWPADSSAPHAAPASSSPALRLVREQGEERLAHAELLARVRRAEDGECAASEGGEAACGFQGCPLQVVSALARALVTGRRVRVAARRSAAGDQFEREYRLQKRPRWAFQRFNPELTGWGEVVLS